MALPGLLIEYLVNGSMALLWFLPLVGVDIEGGVPLGKAAALVPAMYVLGMFVDFVAFVLVSKLPRRKYSLKALARSFVHRKADLHALEGNVFQEGRGRSSRGMIWSYLNAPDLVKELHARSSRDRVARGAVVNILVMWLCSARGYPTLAVIEMLGVWHWLGLAGFALLAWVFLEANSFSFELRAGVMGPKE